MMLSPEDEQLRVRPLGAPLATLPTQPGAGGVARKPMFATAEQMVPGVQFGQRKPLMGRMQGMMQGPNVNPVPAEQPPQFTPPVATLPAGVQGQQFGPGNDLRHTQINPDQTAPQFRDERLAGIRGAPLGGYGNIQTQYNPQHLAARTAAAQQGDISGGPEINAGSYDTGPEAARARQLSMGALENVMTGPDRGAIAAARLAQFDRQSAPALQQQFTDVGRRAAALGRLGSGMTTSNLGDIFTAHQGQRNDLQERLALASADQELGDRMGRLNAASGFGGQLRGEDLGEAGFRQGLRGEQRGERGYQYGVNRDNREDSYRRAGMLGDLDREGYGMARDASDERRGERAFNVGLDQYNRDDSYRRSDALGRLDMEDYTRRGAARDELRGERGYQTGMENQSYGRGQDAQSRNLDITRMMMGLGFGSDPTGAMLAASQGQAGAADNGYQQMLAEIMRKRAAQ